MQEVWPQAVEYRYSKYEDLKSNSNTEKKKKERIAYIFYQSCGPEPAASPGNLLKLKVLEPNLRPTELKTLAVNPAMGIFTVHPGNSDVQKFKNR
jgi:hypothetical protein